MNDVRKGSGNENLVEPTDEVYTGLLDEDKKLVETDFMKQNAKFQHGQYTRKDADSPSINMEATDLPGKNPLEVAINAAKKEGEEALTPKRFDDLTINKDEADTFYKAGNAIGSIFTHDLSTEQALWDIWGEEKSLGSSPSPQLEMSGVKSELMAPVPVIDVSPNAPGMGATGGMISSELLAQVVSQISTMEKETAGVSGNTNMAVSSNTSVDNRSQMTILPASTAHAPAMPSGTGSMGIFARG